MGTIKQWYHTPMVRKINKYPNPILRHPAKLIDEKMYRSPIKDHIEDMKETLAAEKTGMALASNQIATDSYDVIFPVRAFVVKPGTRLQEVILNPRWSPAEGSEITVHNEGCLSIPEASEGLGASRHTKVSLSWQDEDFKSHREEFDGIEAMIIQHECDHLDGRLIVDHVDPKVKIGVHQLAIKNRKAGR